MPGTHRPDERVRRGQMPDQPLGDAESGQRVGDPPAR
jgi:hypothetical protein